ncbi:hypothetical protein [Atopomonas sediminilitoris]|nr:hypothetical protein [Atopomonas sediminilitoris]MCJ8168270.1 hypothetical protein [Atopomonas sediminilitoris]
MQRKPDLLWVLALILGLGIVTTGYTQSQWQPEQAEVSTPVISLQAK